MARVERPSGPAEGLVCRRPGRHRSPARRGGGAPGTGAPRGQPRRAEGARGRADCATTGGDARCQRRHSERAVQCRVRRDARAARRRRDGARAVRAGRQRHDRRRGADSRCRPAAPGRRKRRGREHCRTRQARGWRGSDRSRCAELGHDRLDLQTLGLSTAVGTPISRGAPVEGDRRRLEGST